MNIIPSEDEEDFNLDYVTVHHHFKFFYDIVYDIVPAAIKYFTEEIVESDDDLEPYETKYIDLSDNKQEESSDEEDEEDNIPVPIPQDCPLQ